ncbi:MogA/MoaB family molybdenum cofactor biosynthesis protein [Aporhodopirellula aestuarii]|uniref:Molybdenum cofactor biosynthesis protein B n=1 Tax=Aporhodopirellula aestuarii TaxID=2950107 RepID=A0ABT0U3V4_9BACT|nr:MogA/MoaB family molybdenum cofactor biosynthesis protein [Aporhodopirellula aestuarii]MCM2371600.1 MogA/MoaB family molybdenum cofactor biosynthesis protein [Aporhodopirellula aestuarii]
MTNSSHSPAEHHCESPDCGCGNVDVSAALRVVVITLSDTRTIENDPSGDRIVALLKDVGHELAERIVITDDPDPLRESIQAFVADDSVDAIITTGGTGIAPRDLAVDVIEDLLEVSLPGFGEHFRAVSIQEIGPKAMLSRATAGRIGRVVVFALPGSTGAVTTAMNHCVLPIIRHASALVKA